MSDPADSVTDVNMTRDNAQASSLPAFPRVPALQYATQLDPDRIAGMSPTPAGLRHRGALDGAAYGQGAERRPRPNNALIAHRRRDAALENAAGSQAGADLAHRHGATEAALSWLKNADDLLAAAAALTCWIDWLERHDCASDEAADQDDPANWPTLSTITHRPAWHPPPGITQAARGPLSPRAPARALERTEA